MGCEQPSGRPARSKALAGRTDGCLQPAFQLPTPTSSSPTDKNPHRIAQLVLRFTCRCKLGDILCQVCTAQSRHSRLRCTPLSLAFPNQRLRSELRKPADCAIRTRKPLVPIKLRICFPHRLEPPDPCEVEVVVDVFKRSGNGSSRMAALTGKPPSCWTP